MLSRARRLHQPRDFVRVYRRGARIQSAILVLHHLRGTEAPRIGFVVSTKVSRKSTQRNRIKRIIREWVRLHFTELGSGDYVFVARPGIEKEEPAAIRNSLARLWGRIRE